MNETHKRSISLGTETSDGFIQHKRMTVAGYTFDAPVALQRHRGVIKSAMVNGDKYPVPMTDGGRLMYALPGGLVTHAG